MLGVKIPAWPPGGITTAAPNRRVAPERVRAVLSVTILTHNEIYRTEMERPADPGTAMGVRDDLLLDSGGTQVTNGPARAWGIDSGFGRGAEGRDGASFLVRALRLRPGAEGTPCHDGCSGGETQQAHQQSATKGRLTRKRMRALIRTMLCSQQGLQVLRRALDGYCHRLNGIHHLIWLFLRA